MNISEIKKRCKSGTLGRAGHFFTTYDHLAPAGTTIEDVLNYQYWIDEAHQFDVCNKIEVITEDLSFRALLLVEQAEKRVGAKVSLLEYQEIGKLEKAEGDLPEMTSAYTVKWMGANKWSVLRNSDNAYITKGHQNKQDAEFVLKQHLKGVAA